MLRWLFETGIGREIKLRLLWFLPGIAEAGTGASSDHECDLQGDNPVFNVSSTSSDDEAERRMSASIAQCPLRAPIQEGDLVCMNFNNVLTG
jgi:hypothetical protein